MKKLLSKVMKPSIRNGALLVLAGVALGISAGYMLWHDDKKSPVTASLINTSAQTQERIKTGLERAKEEVSSDLDRKRITKEQASKINAKLNEAYEFRKNIDSNSREDRAKLRQERDKWRNWAKENGVPSTYFLRLY